MNTIKFKKAMTLIEIVIAVAVLGMAIVPIVGMINNQIKKAYSLGGTRDYVDRAKNLMENILEKVSYREIQRFNPVVNPDINIANLNENVDREPSIIDDLSQIRTIFPENPMGGSAEVNMTNYAPEDFLPLIDVYDQDKKGKDTPIDKYVVSGGKTFFRYKGVEYYFTLEITDIPLAMSYKSFLDGGMEKIEEVYTRDKNGNKRSMFKKIVIRVKWNDYNSDREYTLVSFKANIETAFDNE